MALPDVDIQHLMRFAERTNELVCSANSNLERIANHPSVSFTSLVGSGKKGYSSSLSEIMDMEGRIGKRPCFHLPFRLGQGGPFSGAAECVTSVREQRAPSLRPGLPVEILNEIFCLLIHQQLLPVLLCNSFLYQIARRRFYHTIVIGSPKDAIAFLKSLLHNPDLPSLVRSFELRTHTRKEVGHSPVVSPTSIQPHSNSAYSPLLTHNFYSLLHRGLCAMRSLLSLTLELEKPHSPVWIFDDCTFLLRQFSTSMHCNCHLAEFLEKQEMIEDLTLRGFQAESLFFLPFLSATATALLTDQSISPLSFTLSPSALSRLKTFNAIHAGPAIIHTIMQGRSVEIASIPLFPGRSIPTLNALGSGKASLKRLSVISFDPDAPEYLFEELAGRFKDLEALHIVSLMADYSDVSFSIYRVRP